MFILEQEEYQREGIKWNFIDFGLDLQPTIDLLERPMGVLSLLDEECWFPKATDKSFVEKLASSIGQHPKFQQVDFRSHAHFSIMHYAGAVDYSADMWLMKNMDPLNENVVSLLQSSQDAFLRDIWKDAEIVGMGDAAAAETQFGARIRKGMFRTVGQMYKDQLAKLMALLRNTNPNFVRCIIPNMEKKAGKIDSQLVLHQLRCNGVLEGIRICRQGFPSRIPFQEFRSRYELLTPNAIPAGFMDGKRAVDMMVQSLDIDKTLYRIGQSKIFFRAGVVAQLEEERDLKLTDLVTSLQAACRGVLARRSFQKRLQQLNAIRVIQRNCSSYLRLRNWEWWRLFTKVRPLLVVANSEEKYMQVEDAYRATKDKLDMLSVQYVDLEKRLDQKVEESSVLNEQLEKEMEMHAESEELRGRLEQRSTELDMIIQEYEARMEDEAAQLVKLVDEKKHLSQRLQDLQAELEEEESAKQKLQLDRVAAENRMKKLEADLAIQQDSAGRLAREKKVIDDRLEEVRQKQSEDEERIKQVLKLKQRAEASLADVEDRLQREQAQRQESERTRRHLEKELSEQREQLSDVKISQDELRLQLAKTEEQLTQSLTRCDEEAAQKVAHQKLLREANIHASELQEDLESEKLSRAKAEKLRKDLNEELEALKTELEESHDTTAAHQAIQVSN